MLAAELSCPRGGQEGACLAYPSFTVVCFWLPNNINNTMKGDISGTLLGFPISHCPRALEQDPCGKPPFPLPQFATDKGPFASPSPDFPGTADLA